MGHPGHSFNTGSTLPRAFLGTVQSFSPQFSQKKRFMRLLFTGACVFLLFVISKLSINTTTAFSSAELSLGLFFRHHSSNTAEFTASRFRLKNVATCALDGGVLFLTWHGWLMRLMSASVGQPSWKRKRTSPQTSSSRNLCFPSSSMKQLIAW